MSERAEKAINYIRDKAEEFARAKSNRVHLEQFRKSKKAMLVQMAPEACKTAQAKESYAYAHEDYVQLCEGLREAVFAEEKLRYEIEAARLRFEQWRTQEANGRAERQRYGA